MTAANGGGGFLLIFLISTILIDFPLLLAEFALAVVLAFPLSKPLENWARITSTTLSVGLAPLPSLSSYLFTVLSEDGF
ncbi:sodium-dependent transporter [Streptococcus pneumoniae]|nr:sodium-dependent transporter [Streptococcus pneumoniae]VOW76155.1 sodium-dependent transporter [Streptococcus pneumoniae]VQB44906.1 sodium-dependent transporter [Streptococcus pneumoniae]VSO35575.1 sodium-dependent transporter [Streptococcus pneumoniae]VTE28651.1 sodium-dependent transporter [Streptococcus pneumoniae]